MNPSNNPTPGYPYPGNVSNGNSSGIPPYSYAPYQYTHAEPPSYIDPQQHNNPPTQPPQPHAYSNSNMGYYYYPYMFPNSSAKPAAQPAYFLPAGANPQDSQRYVQQYNQYQYVTQQLQQPTPYFAQPPPYPTQQQQQPPKPNINSQVPSAFVRPSTVSKPLVSYPSNNAQFTPVYTLPPQSQQQPQQSQLTNTTSKPSVAATKNEKESDKPFPSYTPISVPSITPYEEQIQQSTLARKTGWLTHWTSGNSEPPLPARSYFVLRGHLLMRYPTDDPESSIDPTHKLIEAIDLSTFEIQIPGLGDNNSPIIPFCFEISSIKEGFECVHHFIASSTKETVEWLVALGQKTSRFSVEREREMVDAVLEQADIVSQNPLPPTQQSPNSIRPPTPTSNPNQHPQSQIPKSSSFSKFLTSIFTHDKNDRYEKPSPTTSPTSFSLSSQQQNVTTTSPVTVPPTSLSNSTNINTNSNPTPSPITSPRSQTQNLPQSQSQTSQNHTHNINQTSSNVSSRGTIRSINKEEKRWLAAVMKQPDNRDFVVPYLMRILCSDHPFGIAISKFATDFKTSVQSDSSPHLQQIVADIKVFIQLMMDSIANHYFEIPTYCPPPLANIFMRTAVVETLFSLIYDDVFTLYARKYTEDDAIHALKTNQFLTLSPAHLAIKQKFWLNMWTNDDGTPMLNSSGEIPILSPPYHNAVLTLRALPSFKSPVQKVACLVKTVDAIYKCIQDHWKGKLPQEELVVGADELLPIFSYVVIKANVGGVYSESMFMQDFIGEDESRQLEGYLLVTFQTSLAFMRCLEPHELSENVAQLFEKAFKKTVLGSESSEQTVAPVVEATKKIDETNQSQETKVENENQGNNDTLSSSKSNFVIHVPKKEESFTKNNNNENNGNVNSNDKSSGNNNNHIGFNSDHDLIDFNDASIVPSHVVESLSEAFPDLLL